MSTITVSHVTGVTHPHGQIAQRVLNAERLAAEKAIAHFVNPTTYPLPADPECAEQSFWQMLQRLQPHQQQALVAKILPTLQASAQARAQLYGELAEVDLHSTMAVHQQIQALSLPAAQQFVQAVAQAQAQVAAIPAAAPAPQAPALPFAATALQLRLRRLHCVQMTSKPFFEWDPDAIDLAGVTTDESGDVERIPTLLTGTGFRNGVEATFEPRVLATFDLREGDDVWPKAYLASLLIAERDDWGHIDEWVGRLYTRTAAEVKKWIADALGGVISPWLGPDLARVIGEAVGALVQWLTDQIFGALDTDVFPPQIIRVDIPAADASFGGNLAAAERVIRFAAHGGVYDLYYDWKLTVPDQPVAIGVHSGQYVMAVNGGGGEVLATAPWIGPWETFTLIQVGVNQIALQASTGHYLCAEGAGWQDMVANRPAIAAWETFEVMELGEGKVALKTANGLYLHAHDGGGGLLHARVEHIDTWETFRIVRLDQLAQIYHWWSLARADNFATTRPEWAGVVGQAIADHEGYYLHRFEGLLFRADQPQPAGTIPIYHWWSWHHRDNLLATDAPWLEQGLQAADYEFVQLEGYLFAPGAQPTGTVPLYRWWSAARGDSFTTTHPDWAGPVGHIRSDHSGYVCVKLEGYVYPTWPG